MVNKYRIVVNKCIITEEGLFMSELMIESPSDLIRLADLKLEYSSDGRASEKAAHGETSGYESKAVTAVELNV